MPHGNILVKAQGYERITAIKIKGVRGFYYCLPEWVNKEGDLNRSKDILELDHL